jgi:hypothetical protein
MDKFLQSTYFSSADEPKPFDIVIIQDEKNDLKYVGLYLGRINGLETMFSQNKEGEFKITTGVNPNKFTVS